MATTLSTALTEAPHTFLTPTLPLYTDTLAYLSHTLNPLAADVSSVQQQRQRDARKKRKRGEALQDEGVLRLKQVHVEGFGPEQVWEQARRVIEAARREAERGLEEAREAHDLDDEDDDESEGLGEEGVDYEVEGAAESDEVYEGSSADELDDAEDGAEDEDDDGDIDMDGIDDFDEGDAIDDEQPAEEYIPDKFGLNDGFFSIDDFNKRSDFLEQQDARGDDDGAASDEEDVDWDADPLGQAAAANGASGDAAMEDAEEEDDEDGPTFGDPDAESEDDEEMEDGEMDGMGDMGLGNTNDIKYADFFAPPAQKKRKNKKGPPNKHNFPAAGPAAAEEPEEDDVERTMAAVHRDLFEDELSGEEEDDEEAAAEKLDPSDPRSRKSTHERRKLALAEEIRKLEAANVAKREWTLSGEARAADRPLNSLLEEDLEFERAGKPVAPVTAEVSESLEELIKRRILAHDFQDIVRRRPDDLATGQGRRGKLDYELDDQKSKKGLAEEYEEEHLKRTDPNYVDARSEKERKEEKEIEALWNKVRTDLDGLSSWNFRPKAPAPTMEIRVDAPTISLEDARPSAGGDVAGASQLAPQEIYKAGEAVSGKEEVAGKSGLPAAREEMSREERKRRRRREKERIRKASGNEETKTLSKKGKERANVVGDLKKGGVKVIGKKGKVTDVEGKEAREGGSGQKGAGRYKL